MPRPTKGEKTPGSGRQPGTVNKKTELLMEKCERMGLDPFEALLQLAKSTELDIRLSALKEICQYLYPKRKALEMSTSEDKGFKVIVENYTDKK